MPDKIWLHKDIKYSTSDWVFGYQYKFAEGIEDEGGIKNFVEYTRTDAFIEKAEEWLKLYVLNHDDIVAYQIGEDFKNYMKGE